MRICFTSLVLALILSGGCNRLSTPTQTASVTSDLQPTQIANSPTAIATSDGFDGNNAYQKYLLKQLEFGPRIIGSKGNRSVGDFIQTTLKETGWDTTSQEFNFRGAPIRNLIGKAGIGRGPIVIIGAHYDTRAKADQDQSSPDAPVPGANDGASGTAVLLELARTLNKTNLNNELWLVFFDGEDNGELNSCALDLHQPTCDSTPWPWSVGADYFAQHLDSKPSSVIVVDMVGDSDQNLFYEENSDAQLREGLWSLAAQLGYSSRFIPKVKFSISDDHTPFLARGIRAVDIIGFGYIYWHTTIDTADKVSPAGLDRIGKVLTAWLYKTP